MDGRVKVFFRLEQDEEGYPEVAVESVWATSSDKPNEYVLDNIPFFVRVATIGDVLKVHEEDGVLWFDCVTKRSSNSLIRVVFFDKQSVDQVVQEVRELGCDVEYSKDFNLLAVSIPGNIELSNVKYYLQNKEGEGCLDFEEPILRQ